MRTRPVDLSSSRHLYPFKSRYLKIHGRRYHYLDEGNGDTLVMLHGNPTWSFFFRNLILALRSEYRVIVPDHIGCGLSEKPDLSGYDFRLSSRVSDLKNFLGQVVPDQSLTLVVHDWGGMIGLAWAMEHWPQVKRMVIMNTSGFFPPGGKALPWQLRLLRLSHPLVERAVLRGNLFARAALYLCSRAPMDRDVKAGLIAPYNCPGNRLATIKFVQDIPLSRQEPSGAIVDQVERNLHRLRRIPVLLLWGGKDFVFSKLYFDEWRRRIPNAEYLWLADAGHYLLEDRPSQVIESISRFLRNHPVK